MANNAYEYTFYDSEAKKEFLAISEEGAVSAFIYSDRFIKGGKAHSVCASGKGRVVAYSGVAYAPLEFFQRALGKQVTAEGRDDVKTSADGEVFLPVIKVAEQLGYCAKAYYSDRLVIIGTEQQIKKMDKDPELAATASSGSLSIFFICCSVPIITSLSE